MAPARTKRGRLSGIDRLPSWADEAKLWAFEQLKERKLSQLDILDGFNERLKVAAFGEGIIRPPQISRSAFNRTAIKVAALSMRLQETREIAAVIAPKLDEAGDNSLTLLVAETLKTLISEMLGNAGELKADGDTAEMLMLTSRALKHAEEAKRISADGRRKIEAEFKAKASKAVDQIAKAKGLTTETIDAIKAKILGIDRHVIS
ncbi:DUF3486 family protein [Rhodopseudomonas palustris]|uniref:DUF3486 family protein n=1 Tax=Rhodopseudomonas palustris TaxID=1076 RepID=A0A418V4B3_RHOPL|nr:DUF3486 family protein [Rhodopseudomonas palustris]RJF70885.1 DUF3486 family protein [Rhodopseudomonas palustris]